MVTPEQEISALKLVIEDLKKQLKQPPSLTFGYETDQKFVQAKFGYISAYCSHMLYQNDPRHWEVTDPTGAVRPRTLKGFYLDLNNLPDFITIDPASPAVQFFLMLGRKPDPGTNPATFRGSTDFTIMVLGLDQNGEMVKDPVTHEPVIYEYLTPATVPCTIACPSIESRFP